MHPLSNPSSFLLALSFLFAPTASAHRNLPRRPQPHPHAEPQPQPQPQPAVHQLDERLLPITATTTVVVPMTATRTVWVQPTGQVVFPIPGPGGEQGGAGEGSGTSSAESSVTSTASAQPSSTASASASSSADVSASASASASGSGTRGKSAAETGHPTSSLSASITEVSSSSAASASGSGSAGSPSSSYITDSSFPTSFASSSIDDWATSSSSSSSDRIPGSSGSLSDWITDSITNTATSTGSESSHSSSASASRSASASASASVSASVSASASASASRSASTSSSSSHHSASASSLSSSAEWDESSSSSTSIGPSETATDSTSVTATASVTSSANATETGTLTLSNSETASASITANETAPLSSTETASVTSSLFNNVTSTTTAWWETETASASASVTESVTNTSTWSVTNSNSESQSSTFEPTTTSLLSITASLTSTATASASATSGALDPISDTIMAAYYPDWSAYHLAPESMDWSRFDVVDFAFALPTADYGLTFTQDDSADLLNRLVKVAHAAGKRVKLSIGGWTGSQYFSPMAASADHRATFVKHVLEAYEQYNLDGIDIDWEYPGTTGADGNAISSDDSANFLLLLKELRAALPDGALITLATQVWPFAGSDGRPMSDVSAFAAVIDWILIMNYDVWGSSSTPGPNAPLSDGCGNSTQPLANAYAAISSWTGAGMPANQITLGVPAYGYLQQSTASSLRQRRSSFPVPPHKVNSTQDLAARGYATVYNDWGGSSDGQIMFESLIQQGALTMSDGQYTGGSGFERYWDECSSTPWLKSEHSGQIITYDDPQSMNLKGQFAAQVGLKGCNIFSADGDWTGSSWPLTDAVRSGLGL